MKGIILSTHPTIQKWRSLKKKLTFFDRIYNSGTAGEVWEPWKLESIDVVPKVNSDDRIDRQWLEDLQKPYFSKGYDFVKFHGSRKQKRQWGVITTLRGSNPNNKNDYEYMYFFADENTKREGLNEFEQVGGHEGGHGYYDGTKEVDLVHAWHDRNPDISGLFKLMDWSKYQPDRMRLRKKVSLLQRLLELIGLKNRLEAKNEPQKPILPVPFLRITQEYGVYNPSLYPSTNYHWGLDLRASLGTPIKAPLDGEVIEVGYSKALGHWVQFYSDNRYFVIPHMAKTTQVGKYKQGDIIGNVGNTGFMTAVHFHIEVWKVRMVNRIKQLKEEGWEVTEDPKEYFSLTK